MSVFGPPNIERLAKRKDIDGLIKALSYPKDKQIRDNAVLALARLGDSRAVEPLIAKLTSEESTEIKEAVIWILGKLGDPRAINPLINILGPYDIPEQFSLLFNLSILDNPDERKVKDAALDALFDIGEPAFIAMVQARTVEPLIALVGEKRLQNYKAAVRKSLNFRDEKSYAPWFTEAEKKYSAQRKAAAIMLGMIRSASAVEPLIAELAFKNYRDTAASALISIGRPAVAPLIAALKDANGELRAASAELLGKIGDKSALESLIKALKDKEILVRKNAAEALGKIGDDRAIEVLLKALAEKDISQTVADSLKMLGWKPGRDPQGVQYYIAQNEWKQVVEIGEPAVVLLIALLGKSYDKNLKKEAAKALGRIRDVRAVDPLIHALKDKDINLQENAAVALGQIGDPHAIPSLITAIQSEDNKNIKSSLVEALSRMGTPAVEPLINLLGSDRKLDYGVIEALGVIGDQRAAKPLIAVIQDKGGDSFAKSKAAKALGKIGDARAVEPLVALLQGNDISSRNAAAQSLVDLYASGNLDPETKQLILAHRPAITRGHQDTHVDEYSCSFNIRDEGHSIPGTGVDFPL